MSRGKDDLRFTVLAYGTPRAVERWRALEYMAREAERTVTIEAGLTEADMIRLCHAVARLRKASGPRRGGSGT